MKLYLVTYGPKFLKIEKNFFCLCWQHMEVPRPRLKSKWQLWTTYNRLVEWHRGSMNQNVWINQYFSLLLNSARTLESFSFIHIPYVYCSCSVVLCILYIFKSSQECREWCWLLYLKCKRLLSFCLECILHVL